MYDQTNFNVTGITINGPGIYVFDSDVVFNVAGSFAITINSDDVVIDLGGHTLNLNNTSSGGITFNNVNNITIQHGSIINATDNAIFVNSANNILLQDLTIESITGDSIFMQNSLMVKLSITSPYLIIVKMGLRSRMIVKLP